MKYYIKNSTLVNEGEMFKANVLIDDGKIAMILGDEDYDEQGLEVIDAEGKCLIPGIIDEHVHFRDPGLTQKADMFTESHAAVAGGVTSIMDMPNTIPQTTTLDLLQQKFDIAAEKSLVNYSFYLGATNDNLIEIIKMNPRQVCGVKLFMGSSTGNMLMDDDKALEALFKESPCLIAAHCENEDIIRYNTQVYKQKVEQNELQSTATLHPLIRTAEACYKSSAHAVELAETAGARLHVLHVSTEKELDLFRNDIELKDKKITAETCPHYLRFTDEDYETMSFAIKCNPAIKSAQDNRALLQSLKTGLIDTIGSDHAPHLWEEKMTGDYFTGKSGFPSIQHTLDIMLDIQRKGWLTLPQLVQLMCHNPAQLYRIDRRGFIREGYHADLAIVDFDYNGLISNDKEYSKCKWTPFNGFPVKSAVTHTFVNGNLVYANGEFFENWRGKRLVFAR